MELKVRRAIAPTEKYAPHYVLELQLAPADDDERVRVERYGVEEVAAVLKEFEERTSHQIVAQMMAPRWHAVGFRNVLEAAKAYSRLQDAMGRLPDYWATAAAWDRRPHEEAS